MANDYLRLKWKTILEANDLDKDGFLTLKDANLFSERFIAHHRMKGERAKKLKQDFSDFYNNMFILNEEKMQSTKYVELMATSYELDKGAFKDRMLKLIDTLMGLFDVNNDGLISEEEFVIVMKCWGVEKLQQHFIQAYPQCKPGFILNEVYRDSWVAFLTNDDSNDNSVEKPVVTSLGID